MNHYRINQLRSLVERFSFNGKSYRYFCHPYNTTWRNERRVEVPVVWTEVVKNQGKQILELGNVLSHYFTFDHDVVDKYEQAPSVINKDILKYRPSKKYDLIVSISTLEHIGWEEEKREPDKTARTVQHLTKLLKPHGTLIITFPIGYNSDLDKLIKTKKLVFDNLSYLKRVSVFNTWKQVDERIWKEKPQYNRPYNNANAIAVGIITRR